MAEGDLAVHYVVALGWVSARDWRWAAPRLHPLPKVLIQASHTIQNLGAGPYVLERHQECQVQAYAQHNQLSIPNRTTK